MILSAYYLRAHTYTMVPAHVREDMQWMADVGTDNVCVAVLEQDLAQGWHNLDIICQEADRLGMKVHAVPSRWGGIVSGAPKVPSAFTANHPETWILDAEGKTVFSEFLGPKSSIHHPATREFFLKKIEELLTEIPFAGLIWDEVKLSALPDFSPWARKNMPENAGFEWHIDRTANFFGEMNSFARSLRKNLLISLFVYGWLKGYPVEGMAKTPELDFYGCNGRPWRAADKPVRHGRPDSALLDCGPEFIAAAKKYGKHGLLLIETHDYQTNDIYLVDRKLPEVLALDAGHFIYYYYPRNLENPDILMRILGGHLQKAKRLR
jgi:hypothetical protein